MKVSLVVLVVSATSCLSLVTTGTRSISSGPKARSVGYATKNRDYYQGRPREYHFPYREHRKEVTIRASLHEGDDISDEFLAGIKEANCGGMLVLKEGEQYVIGKKLDLTFLDDIHVQLDGQILVWFSDLYAGKRMSPLFIL
jgi:galacturan 1,4-alpha-galacturonidase